MLNKWFSHGISPFYIVYIQYIFFELFLQEKTLEYNPRVKRIGPVVERVLYSLKLKVVPNLKLNHQQPLRKLLPVIRHHPILSYCLGQIRENVNNNSYYNHLSCTFVWFSCFWINCLTVSFKCFWNSRIWLNSFRLAWLSSFTFFVTWFILTPIRFISLRNSLILVENFLIRCHLRLT